MNERIRQLIKQAQINDLAIDTNGDLYDVKQLDPEKFAELIVKECCHIMNTTANKAEESNTYMGDDVPTRVHQYTIKQHFGVEE
jgi:hypothetical protein